jgi:hypothetical protein
MVSNDTPVVVVQAQFLPRLGVRCGFESAETFSTLAVELSEEH